MCRSDVDTWRRFAAGRLRCDETPVPVEDILTSIIITWTLKGNFNTNIIKYIEQDRDKDTTM